MERQGKGVIYPLFHTEKDVQRIYGCREVTARKRHISTFDYLSLHEQVPVNQKTHSDLQGAVQTKLLYWASQL